MTERNRTKDLMIGVAIYLPILLIGYFVSGVWGIFFAGLYFSPMFVFGLLIGWPYKNTGDRYWLEGLTIGIAIYLLTLLVLWITSDAEKLGFFFGGIYTSPILLSGLLVGLLFAKPQKLQ